MDWYLEVRIRARDRQHPFCLLIQGTKIMKILKRLTWMFHVMHNMEETPRRGILGWLIFPFGQCWHSIRLDRMQSFFKEHVQFVVFQKLSDWRLEKSYVGKHTCHFEPPPKISLRHDWARGEVPLGSTVDPQSEGEVSCSTVTRSCQTSKILPTNPTNPKANLWLIRAT